MRDASIFPRNFYSSCQNVPFDEIDRSSRQNFYWIKTDELEALARIGTFQVSSSHCSTLTNSLRDMSTGLLIVFSCFIVKIPSF